jgi:membrane protein
MTLWEQVKQNRLVNLVVTTYDEFGADNGSLLASAVSYNMLFSLFPFALAIISLAGFVMQSTEFENEVITAVGNLIPVARHMIVNTLNGLIEARAVTGLIALVGLIWSATSFCDALRRSLNTAWGITDPVPFLKGKLINVAMVIAAFAVFTLFVWATTFVRFVHETNITGSSIKILQSTAFSRLLFLVMSSLIAYGVILLLYRFIPGRRPRWRDIWLGALLSTAGFEIIRVGFLWYVKNFASYNMVYGSVGTVIALLAFIYFTAWVLLFCAKFSAVRAKLNSGTT